MYTVYCANQPNSMSCLDRLSKQSAFKAFLAECLENPTCRGLTLFSFLIKPIQRICKYPLLLRVIVFIFYVSSLEKMKFIFCDFILFVEISGFTSSH
jgi:hypothetical protein